MPHCDAPVKYANLRHNYLYLYVSHFQLSPFHRLSYVSCPITLCVRNSKLHPPNYLLT